MTPITLNLVPFTKLETALAIRIVKLTLTNEKSTPPVDKAYMKIFTEIVTSASDIPRVETLLFPELKDRKLYLRYEFTSFRFTASSK